MFSATAIWQESCCVSGMILLITPSHRGPECAKAIEYASSHVTHVVSTFPEAAVYLRNHDCAAVVIDEGLLAAEPNQGNLLVEQAGAATLVYINCAINSSERIVREVQNALQRREREQTSARKAAAFQLQCELREPLTGMILNCELALQSGQLAGDLEPRIRMVDALAHELAAKIEIELIPAVKP